MNPVTKHVLATTALLLVGAAVGAAVFVASGSYNIAADDPHTAPVTYLLETLRERSMEMHAASLQVPDLGEQRRILEGAGNYNAMCVGCHLAPGMEATEISRGLYPSPPNLSRESVEPRHAFWAIKHGIKASGMPAWGKGMNDQTAWNMTAFLVRMPQMSPQQYEELVASSGGHSHGGAEGGGAHGEGHEMGSQKEHGAQTHAEDHGMHDKAAPDAEHGSSAGAQKVPATIGVAAGKTASGGHVHADGKSHDHGAGSK
ncbi:MAG: cytochrome c [Rubrivivax sp.]